jgi:hypothetical protein
MSDGARTRSINTGKWIAVMPSSQCDAKSRELYISRFLANKLINPVAVMLGFIPELIEMLGSQEKTVPSH